MTTALTVTTNLELDPWTDLLNDPLPLNDSPLGHRRSARIHRIGLLPDGTDEGRPTVALDIVLPDGRHVLAETTWRLLSAATASLAASPVVQIDRELNGGDF